MSITIKGYANCDEVYVVWESSQHIPDCRGFAVYRRRNGQEEPLDNWVGFQGENVAPGTFKPTTEWPIQKFMWSDFFVHTGDVVQYRVVPMLGTQGNLRQAADQASDWSAPVTVTAISNTGISAYFNRGIVATQWLARRLGGTSTTAAQKQQRLATIMATPQDPTRNFLGGELRGALLKLLADAASSGGTIYAALFELDDPELIPALVALGPRANVILANGSTKEADQDENHAARATLRQGKVNVFDRMLPIGRLAHNKFLVLCDASGHPQRVWTGSTNWTKTGLCTQANNGILIPDLQVATAYRAEWDLLKAAGNDSPPDLVNANSQKKAVLVAGRPTTIWTTPVRDTVDLADANSLINGAQEGILFLMFNPGPSGTLLNTIIDRNTPNSPTFDAHLYIHGVLNQDPSTTAHPIVGLFHGTHYTESDFSVVLPEAIDKQTAFWQSEIKKYQYAWAMVHSKVIVLDPFGAHPVVMTGSHNMGPKASGTNDDNLIIIENDSALAAAYAVNIMSVFNQYRWRYLRMQQHASAAQPAATRGVAGDQSAPPALSAADIDLADGLGAPPTAALATGRGVAVSSPGAGAAEGQVGAAQFDQWLGLQDNDTWQDVFLAGAKQRELRFWTGQG